MTQGALLDVNVLLSLAWPNHQFHARASAWFSKSSELDWWTCGMTEASFVRLSSNKAFTSHAKLPSDATLLLRRLTEHPRHRFLDCLPPCGSDEFEALVRRLHGHRLVTDAYLLMAARSAGLVLATFDERIDTLGAGVLLLP